MATGWQDLGYLLGGGMDSSSAYEEGRLRTVQTEIALEKARNAQLDNMAAEFKAKNQTGAEDALIQMDVDPVRAKAQATIMNGGLGSDYNQVTQGLGHQQENDFRARLGNPGASLADQFAAGQGVQGKVLNPYDFSGQSVTDLRAPNAPGQAPTVFTTPIGQSEIGFNNARAEAALHPPLDPNKPAGGAEKAPSGFIANPQYDPNMDPVLHPEIPDTGDIRGKAVLPMSGGPQDPSSPRRLDNRGMQQLNRVVNAAVNTAGDIEALVALPAGVSQGMFGAGGNPGQSLLQTTVDNLKLATTDQWDRFYLETLPGFSQQLRVMESYGMPGAVSAANQFDALAFRKPDSVEDHLYKLATIKQTVQSALDTAISTGGVPTDKINQMRDTLARINKAVPFDRADVIAFTQQKNKRMTLSDVIKQRQLASPVSTGPHGGPAAPAGTSPPPPNPGTEEKPGANFPMQNQRGWKKMRDKVTGDYAYVSPDGTQFEEIQ